MKLWTIQPAEVWCQIQADGVAKVDRFRMFGADYVPPAYEWLVDQLALRRDWQPQRLPWWCYCAKPDLRSHRHCCVGSQVRLELEVDAKRALTMPCWAWDTVYRQDYLALTEREKQDWNERMLSSVPLDPDIQDDRIPLWPLPEPWMSELCASWERLFDPCLPASHWTNEHIFEGTEAVIQEIRGSDVRNVTAFTGARTERFRRCA